MLSVVAQQSMRLTVRFYDCAINFLFFSFYTRFLIMTKTHKPNLSRITDLYRQSERQACLRSSQSREQRIARLQLQTVKQALLRALETSQESQHRHFLDTEHHPISRDIESA